MDSEVTDTKRHFSTFQCFAMRFSVCQHLLDFHCWFAPRMNGNRRKTERYKCDKRKSKHFSLKWMRNHICICTWTTWIRMHLIREYLYGFYKIHWDLVCESKVAIWFFFWLFVCFGCFYLKRENLVRVDTVLTYCTVSFVASVKARRNLVLLLCDRVSPCGHRRTP